MTVAPASCAGSCSVKVLSAVTKSLLLEPVSTKSPRVSSPTVGAVVSTLKPPLGSTAASVSTASLPAASRMVPPLSVRAPAGMATPSASVWPATMV